MGFARNWLAGLTYPSYSNGLRLSTLIFCFFAGKKVIMVDFEGATSVRSSNSTE